MKSSILKVSEYSEIMCDVCNEHDYGTFVEINNHRICRDCCEEMNTRLKVNDYEAKLRNE